ncbi:MAG: hypothetical protein WC657_05810 [Candidatus Paceibacterota bacterium]
MAASDTLGVANAEQRRSFALPARYRAFFDLTDGALMPGIGFPLLGVPGVGPGAGGGPVNTVAPAIASSAVIGTTITPTAGTWTGSPTLTYQWQRYVGAAWQDISGATTAARAPVDADFGYALRLAEIANGNAALAVASNATGLAAEAPVQSLGVTNVVVEGDMEAATTAAWTPGNAAVLSKETGTPHGGTQVLRSARNSTNTPTARQAILNAAKYYEFTGYARSDGNATPRVGDIFNSVTQFNGTTSTSWQSFRFPIRPGGVDFYLVTFTSTGNEYCEFDDLVVKELTLNTQLVAPSADGVLTFLYTLPETPLQSDQLWFMPRISDFATGNYWIALLIYTVAGQWDLSLHSVATKTRSAAKFTASNIGASNGIQITLSANDWAVKTTADAGENWTSRGTHNNALYNTATGVNVVASSGFVLGALSYSDPN